MVMRTVTEATFAVLALLVLGWAVTSRLLSRVNINGSASVHGCGIRVGEPRLGSFVGGVRGAFDPS